MSRSDLKNEESCCSLCMNLEVCLFSQGNFCLLKAEFDFFLSVVFPFLLECSSLSIS